MRGSSALVIRPKVAHVQHLRSLGDEVRMIRNIEERLHTGPGRMRTYRPHYGNFIDEGMASSFGTLKGMDVEFRDLPIVPRQLSGVECCGFIIAAAEGNNVELR
jgi:hypothetical protein